MDSINFYGVLKLKIYDKGELVQTIEEKNLIVNGGRDVLLRRLIEDVTLAADFQLTDVVFGTGQSAANQTDTFEIFTDPVLVPITSKTIDVSGVSATANFEFALDEETGNGKNIYEFGLVCGDEDQTLFSRRVRTQPITKTNTMSFLGTWQIIAQFS